MENHIWRKMQSPPYLRYACTIVQDRKVPDGYRVVEHDPHVATLPFLHSLSMHLTRSQPVRSSVTNGDEVVETMTSADPGEIGHFAAAIRTIPNAYLCPAGRS